MSDYEKYKIKITDAAHLYIKRDDESALDAKDITYKALDALEGHFLEHNALPDKVKEARRKRLKGIGHSVEKTHPKLFKAIKSTLTNTCGKDARFRMDMVDSPTELTKKHGMHVFEHSGIGIKAERVKTVRRE